MPFKRYGGEIESGGSWPTGRFFLPASLITLFGSMVAYGVGSFELLGFCFLTSIILITLGAIFPGSPKPTVQDKIRESHHMDAIKYYESGNIESLKESLRKYKIYGPLPEDLIEIEREIENA